jgi:gamma-glutamyltranspeptidase/glutathione hydrolase
MDQAVSAVRLHHQWLPDSITAEEALPAATEAGLRALGHELRRRRAMGHANCIEVDPQTRGFRAIADHARAGGKASAW